MGKPSVAILLALYRPDRRWLTELLDFLNHQSYRPLSLFVWNDCPEDVTAYEPIFRAHIDQYPVQIFRGARNLGVNGAFAALTRIAESDYVAYCDQDDVWLPHKISCLVDAMQRAGEAKLVCSDMYVMDEAGRVVADSIAAVRPYQRLYRGGDPFRRLIAHNFVTGCTLLAERRFAQAALPFPKEYMYDWWLGFHAAAQGGLITVSEPLIRYRIHGDNQTGPLLDIGTKQDYYEKRILLFEARMQLLGKVFCDTPYGTFIEECRAFAACRSAYQRRWRADDMVELLRLRKYSLKEAFFELCLPFLPEHLFQRIIRRGQKKY